MTSELLKISNLSIEFRTGEGIVRAVDDISFSLAKGSILGIVGESGSGKSVTALSVLRLIQRPGKITSGEIIYYGDKKKGADLLKLKERDIRDYRGKEISMIFQEPMTSLNPVYKCGRQVDESMLVHRSVPGKGARERTLRLFADLRLPDPETIYHSYPHELSGGQKQRVMIAMAMSCNPKILIADEPTTALDVTVQKSILGLMKELRSRYGMSIIFITHDLGVVSEIADEIIVMKGGRIVETGKTADIFLNPSHPYTRGLIACRPPLDRRYRRLPTVSDFIEKDRLSVDEFTDELVLPEDEWNNKRNMIFSNAPFLNVSLLKTSFRRKAGLFGKRAKIIAVDEVTFDIFPGETFGLVGESGCGKTTLGRTILRLIKHDGGKIVYNGIDLTSLDHKRLRKQRKEIQTIFQDPFSSLNPRITVGSAIMEPMRVFKLHSDNSERKAKALELLEKVGLEPVHFNRYPHEFSGGQRQRICIARALAVSPKFIICDESVSSLDVSIQAQILNLLNNLKDEFGFSYIFISHDLSVVRYMSERVAVMKEGKIIELGDSDEIYNNPKEDYTKKLISSIPGLKRS